MYMCIGGHGMLIDCNAVGISESAPCCAAGFAPRPCGAGAAEFAPRPCCADATRPAKVSMITSAEPRRFMYFVQQSILGLKPQRRFLQSPLPLLTSLWGVSLQTLSIKSQEIYKPEITDTEAKTTPPVIYAVVDGEHKGSDRRYPCCS